MANTSVVLLAQDDEPRNMQEASPKMQRGCFYLVENVGDKPAHWFIKGPNKVHKQMQPPRRKDGGHILRAGQSRIIGLPTDSTEFIWLWSTGTRVLLTEVKYVR